MHRWSDCASEVQTANRAGNPAILLIPLWAAKRRPQALDPAGWIVAFEMSEILRSKREFRQKLAARPLAERLCLLDHLRERSRCCARENGCCARVS
jgi:hypothetical protein